MKKSILTLGAAVALGALGLSTTAGAVAAFDENGAATGLALHQAGTGHMLFTPYFSAQDGMGTIVTIVNTDTKNGKAVKVRFRGASNSDDLLDFTLFLSPGDVWSGSVTEGPNGFAQVDYPSDETSCTIPEHAAFPAEFMDLRLPGDVDTAALTREGYVEVLNMADIPAGTDPARASGNSVLYDAIKHKNGVAPCEDLDVNTLTDANFAGSFAGLPVTGGEPTDEAGIQAKYGLAYPTGGLMGSWNIINLSEMGSFAGTQQAIIATDGNAGPDGTFATAAANLVFAPQTDESIEQTFSAADAGTFISEATADLLLRAAAVEPLWFDFPDMSTPLTGTLTDADGQAANLAAAMAKGRIFNEYMATDAGAHIPFKTDWVVSQPVRRYLAVVDYSGPAPAVYTNGLVPNNPYVGRIGIRDTDFGPMACVNLNFGSYDREESQKASAGSFSPGRSSPYCGEVFTLQFGDGSILGAKITASDRANTDKVGEAGWAQLVTKGLPVTGYAAVQYSNSKGTRYNETLEHRWGN